MYPGTSKASFTSEMAFGRDAAAVMSDDFLESFTKPEPCSQTMKGQS